MIHATTFFGARYFSAPQGRFMSPDAPFLDQDEYSPQSWNLYAYVQNNPLRYADPSGTKCVELDNGSFADDGAGGGCEAAGVDADGNIQPYEVEVTAEKGNVINSFILNALFAADALAQAYFEPLAAAIGVRPSYMESIPLSTDYTGVAAQGGVFLGSIFLGPGGALKHLRSVDDLISGVRQISSSQRLLQLEGSGGAGGAASAFADLARGVGQNARTTQGRGGIARVIDLPGGGTVSLRNFSKEGRPTIQINRPGEIPVKIRF